MADREGHGENRQAKRQGHASKPDAQPGECSRQDCAAATAEHQPESPDEFRTKLFSHLRSPSSGY